MAQPSDLPRRAGPRRAADRERSPHCTRFVEGFNDVLVVGLVLLGVGGLCYKLIAPGGWIAMLLGERWTVPGYLNTVVPVTAMCIMAAAWMWLTRSKTLRKHGDVALYLFMALGLFFLFELISTGAL